MTGTPVPRAEAAFKNQGPSLYKDSQHHLQCPSLLFSRNPHSFPSIISSAVSFRIIWPHPPFIPFNEAVFPQVPKGPGNKRLTFWGHDLKWTKSQKAKGQKVGFGQVSFISSLRPARSTLRDPLAGTPALLCRFLSLSLSIHLP